MSTETDWIAVGSEVVIYGASQSFASSTPSIETAVIERLTATQIVLKGGKRFNRSDLRERGGNYYNTGRLLSVDDPRVAEASEARRVDGLRLKAGAAVDHWTRNRRDTDLARAAATALLAYAEGAKS